MPAPLWFLLLEAVFGSLILWLGYRQLRVLQREWPVEKTDTTLPADDKPNLAVRKALLFLCGTVMALPLLGMLVAKRYEAPDDAYFWISLVSSVSIPSYHAVLAYFRERLERRPISASHPWSEFVEEIAQIARVPLSKVYFRVESDLVPYAVDADGLVLPSAALRNTPPDVLAFYICARLYDLKTGFVAKRRVTVGLMLFGYALTLILLKQFVSVDQFTMTTSMSTMIGFMFSSFVEIFGWQPHRARERFALEVTNDSALAEKAIRKRWELEKGNSLSPKDEAKLEKYLAKVGIGWVPKAASTLPAPMVIAPEESAPVSLGRQ